MGVELRQVTGRYKAGTNPIEAKAVVEAAYEFMRTDPNRSLGIVTLKSKAARSYSGGIRVCTKQQPACS
jgi:hypothetical protein